MGRIESRGMEGSGALMAKGFVFIFPGETMSHVHEDLSNRLFRTEGKASYEAEKYLDQHQMDAIKFYNVVEVNGFPQSNIFNINDIFVAVSEEYYEANGEDIDDLLDGISADAVDELITQLHDILHAWLNREVELVHFNGSRTLYAREGKYQRYMYSLEELYARPTIEEGHTDDLKIFKEKEYKVWLSRSPIHEVIANNIDRVTVEEYREGKWEVVFSYDPERG